VVCDGSKVMVTTIGVMSEGFVMKWNADIVQVKKVDEKILTKRTHLLLGLYSPKLFQSGEHFVEFGCTIYIVL